MLLLHTSCSIKNATRVHGTDRFGKKHCTRDHGPSRRPVFTGGTDSRDGTGSGFLTRDPTRPDGFCPGDPTRSLSVLKEILENEHVSK